MLTMYKTTRDFERSDYTTAVLPIGAVEQHGSHLPVGTDTLIASELARMVAERLGAYLLPAIAISSSIEHRKGHGTIYLKSSTLQNIIRDIAESVSYSGICKLILINGHGGNWILKPTVRQLNRDYEGRLQVILIHSNIGSKRAREVMEKVHNDIHAGEEETSIMMHLYPELVLDVISLDNPMFYPQDYMDYFDVTDLCTDGYWGYPELATAEKGKRIMDITLECTLEYLQQIEAFMQNMENTQRRNARHGTN